MKIALSYRVDTYPLIEGKCSAAQAGRKPLVPVESYARSVDRALVALGHTTENVYGHNTQWNPQDFDVYLELDNGRNPQGHFGFADFMTRSDIQVNIPTAVWFVDSHGQPDLHKGISKCYDHVFFAVWDKRDLFKEHGSAHWCPNATDPSFFYPTDSEPTVDFGFFGSKTGLERADKMIEICHKNNWTYDVRQIGAPYKHKWPRTGEAMNNCRVLFNHGQKHDAPNLRVIESMAVGRPLITDVDPRSGMERLFDRTKHFLGYEAYTYAGLEAQMRFALENLESCQIMADEARKLVLEKHLTIHRAEQMVEVFNATL